jgi:hypothetical protein
VTGPRKIKLRNHQKRVCPIVNEFYELRDDYDVEGMTKTAERSRSQYKE